MSLKQAISMDSTHRSSWPRTNNPSNTTKTLLLLSSCKASSVVQSCRHRRNPLLNPPMPWRHVHRLSSRLHLNSRLLSLNFRGLNNSLIWPRSHNLHSLRRSSVPIQTYILEPVSLALQAEVAIVQRLVRTSLFKVKPHYKRLSEVRVRMLGRKP